jgi:hypothetical protein
MSHELEQCKSHCEKGPFCPGEDCFQKGFNAGFSEKSSAQKQLEELMEDAKKLIV